MSKMGRLGVDSALNIAMLNTRRQIICIHLESVKNMEQLLTVDEVAKRLNISPAHVYTLIRLGELVAVRISAGAKRIDPEDLENFIKSRKVQQVGNGRWCS